VGNKWANSRTSRSVQSVGYVVELVAEQVPVQVQRHRRRLVPEHLLHHLHIRARRDRKGPVKTIQRASTPPAWTPPASSSESDTDLDYTAGAPPTDAEIHFSAAADEDRELSEKPVEPAIEGVAT